MVRFVPFWFGLLALPIASLATAQEIPGLTPLPKPAPTPQVTPADSAQLLFRQGIEQYQAVQFAAAIQSWQRALVLFRQQENPKAAALTLENLGLAYQAIGDYRQAIAHYQAQLIIVRELGDRRSEANALANLGNNYRILGHYTDAMNSGRQSLEIRRQLGDRRGAGQVLANLGNVQADLGNYPQAIELQKRSLKIAQETNNQRGAIIALNSLGFLYSSQANYTDARSAYEQSLELARTTGFRAAEGNALNNLGVVYHAQGNYQQAIAHYQKSLVVGQELSDPRMESTALAGLGFGHASLRDYAAALKYQQQSWLLASKLGDRRLEGIALSNWGDTLWQAGNLAAAEQKVKASLGILESLRSELADADKVSIFDTQRVNYNTLQQIQIAQNRPEAALETAERGRARAFAELLAKRFRESGGDGTAASVAALAPPSIQQIRQIAREQNATLVEYAVIPEDRFVAIGKLTGPDLALFIWVVQPTGNVDFRRVDLRPLRQKKLTLAEVVSIGRCLGAVSTCLAQTALLSRGLGVVGNAEPTPAATPAATTSDATPTSQRRSHAGLQKLHQLLIEPIADLLPTDPNARVVFIPQDALFLVPFPALQSAKNDYLIEQHTLQTAPSIQVLALTRQQRYGGGQGTVGKGQNQLPAPSLIVGNPTMPKLSLMPGEPPTQLSPLPGAEQEATEIAKLLHTTALTQDIPTERTIRQKLPQARLVHLATHGLLEYGTQGNRVSLEGMGIPGAIALAPPLAAPTPLPTDDDGLLTSSEILDLHLNAELVVLSACDTGQGRITGDGVIGLSRAFISAGVPSVIVSLWAVPDAPTARLMTTFYRSLQTTPNKASALRQAMLETMKEHPRPLDWAAFTLIGEAE